MLSLLYSRLTRPDIFYGSQYSDDQRVHSRSQLMSDIKDMGANCIEATCCLEKHKRRRMQCTTTHTHKKISSPGCSPTIQGRAIYNAFPGTYATVRGASHVRIYSTQVAHKGTQVYCNSEKVSGQAACGECGEVGLSDQIELGII